MSYMTRQRCTKNINFFPLRFSCTTTFSKWSPFTRICVKKLCKETLLIKQLICIRMTSLSYTNSRFCSLHKDHNGIAFKNLHFEAHFQKIEFSSPKTPLSSKWTVKACKNIPILSLKWCGVNGPWVWLNHPNAFWGCCTVKCLQNKMYTIINTRKTDIWSLWERKSSVHTETCLWWDLPGETHMKWCSCGQKRSVWGLHLWWHKTASFSLL